MAAIDEATITVFLRGGFSLRMDEKLGSIMAALLRPITKEAGGYSELSANLLQKCH